MALLNLSAPQEAAGLFSQIDVPGKREPANEYHITLAYFGKDVAVGEVARVMAATRFVVSRFGPFPVRTSTLASFPAGEDGVPIICLVDSAPLLDLRAQLVAAYHAEGIDFSEKHEYQPHVTLSYAEASIAARPILPIEWLVQDVVLWGEGFPICTFPLAASLAQRVARRFLTGSR